MLRQTAAAVVVFAVALVAGLVLAGGSSADQAPSTTTTAAPAPATTTIPAVFFSEAETVLGPVAIVASAPYLDRTQLVVEFDTFTLAPTADSPEVIQQLGFGNSLTVPPEALNTVFLRDWTLRTSGQEIEGGTANPAARAARFEVGEGFDLAEIEEISVSSMALLVPIKVDLELGIGNESATVAPDLTARLLAVTEQAKTIVQIELASQQGFGLDTLRVSGTGPGWLSAVREAEGRPRWNLTYDADVAPSPIPIRVEGSLWVSIDRPIAVTLGEEL